MKRDTTQYIFLTSLLFLVAGVSLAYLRCGTKLVHEGDGELSSFTNVVSLILWSPGRRNISRGTTNMFLLSAVVRENTTGIESLFSSKNPSGLKNGRIISDRLDSFVS